MGLLSTLKEFLLEAAEEIVEEGSIEAGVGEELEETVEESAGEDL